MGIDIVKDPEGTVFTSKRALFSNLLIKNNGVSFTYYHKKNSIILLDQAP